MTDTLDLSPLEQQFRELAARDRASAEAWLAEHTRAVNAMAFPVQAAKARESLIPFTQLMLPDPMDFDNPLATRYEAMRPHKAMAAVIEEVEAGRYLRVIMVAPPRHGKTELVQRKGIPWIVGRDPYRSVIFATYNDTFAKDIGANVRECMESERYQMVFPRCRLRTGSKASNHLVTQEGGELNFIGREGSATGRGADFLLIDDPIKDAEEADSPTIRNKLWEWFTRTAMSRLKTDTGRVVIVQTRWHEDDLVGRLTDPNNPCYNEKEARKWKVVHLPAIAEEGDRLGRQPGEALWPERFGIDYLEGFRDLDARGFSALYQGRPTPEDGDFFKKEYVRTYRPGELPKNLRIYIASDHAVGTDQNNDLTCWVIGGIDENDTLWIIDCWWRRATTDVVVEAMLHDMRRYEPSVWWAEKGHISKSIGPFLRKRMLEEHVYCTIDEVTPVKDKQTRAQSIRGRMAMGKVMFPAFMPWFQNAKSQLLKFPNDVHDDFVDALAHLGGGLNRTVRAFRPQLAPKAPPTGTLGWLKWEAQRQKQANESALDSASGF